MRESTTFLERVEKRTTLPVNANPGLPVTVVNSEVPTMMVRSWSPDNDSNSVKREREGGTACPSMWGQSTVYRPAVWGHPAMWGHSPGPHFESCWKSPNSCRKYIFRKKLIFNNFKINFQYIYPPVSYFFYIEQTETRNALGFERRHFERNWKSTCTQVNYFFRVLDACIHRVSGRWNHI